MPWNPPVAVVDKVDAMSRASANSKKTLNQALGICGKEPMGL
jgi:hypothetical protein